MIAWPDLPRITFLCGSVQLSHANVSLHYFHYRLDSEHRGTPIPPFPPHPAEAHRISEKKRLPLYNKWRYNASKVDNSPLHDFRLGDFAATAAAGFFHRYFPMLPRLAIRLAMLPNIVSTYMFVCMCVLLGRGPRIDEIAGLYRFRNCFPAFAIHWIQQARTSNSDV